LGTGFSYPAGVAVDGSGNVFVTDNNNRVVKLDYADAPSLSFATPTPAGSTDTNDGPLTVTVQNIGNETLYFQPLVADNLLDAVLASPGAADCTGLSGLQSGTACTLGIEFQPAQAGLVSGHVNLVDNALNATYATQAIGLQCTGIVGQQTINFPNPGPATYGVAPFTLTATATSGLAVSYTVTSGPATVSGSTLTVTGAGSVIVQASQAGTSATWQLPRSR
jgi:NHL repeat